MIKEYFARCEARFPEQQPQLRQVSLALRREGIDTMEGLCGLLCRQPERLTSVRAIGPKRLELIRQVCELYARESRPAAERPEVF